MLNLPFYPDFIGRGKACPDRSIGMAVGRRVTAVGCFVLRWRRCPAALSGTEVDGCNTIFYQQTLSAFRVLSGYKVYLAVGC